MRLGRRAFVINLICVSPHHSLLSLPPAKKREERKVPRGRANYHRPFMLFLALGSF